MFSESFENKHCKRNESPSSVTDWQISEKPCPWTLGAGLCRGSARCEFLRTTSHVLVHPLVQELGTGPRAQGQLMGGLQACESPPLPHTCQAGGDCGARKDWLPFFLWKPASAVLYGKEGILATRPRRRPPRPWEMEQESQKHGVAVLTAADCEGGLRL